MKKVAIFIFFFALTIVLQADKVNGWGILHEAVYDDNISAVQKIISSKRYDIDCQSKAGISPLHIAVKTRNISIVNLLLEHGADVDIQDNNGYTPLLYAVAQRRFKIVQTLIRHGADINLANNAGITPLQQAAYKNAFKIVDFLLRNNANTEIKNANGVNACELAYLKGNYAMAEYLISFTHGMCGKYANELKSDVKSVKKKGK